MKTPIGALLLVPLLAGFFGCVHSRESDDMTAQRTLKGTIYVVGNEPFTHLALQDSAGRMHRIKGPKAIEDVLYQRQGKPVVLTVVGTAEEAEGPVLQISSMAESPAPQKTPADSVAR